MEVAGVAVLPAEEEAVATLDGDPGGDEGTASDWLPGHPRRARGRGGLASRARSNGPRRHDHHPECSPPHGYASATTWTSAPVSALSASRSGATASVSGCPAAVRRRH